MLMLKCSILIQYFVLLNKHTAEAVDERNDEMKQWSNEAMKKWSNEAMKQWSNEAMKQWSNEYKK